MSKEEEIRASLIGAFEPQVLEIEDESENHRGHAGFREGGETHYRVLIRSDKLAPLSRVARHRAVHAALGADLIGRIHALALDLG